jgi:hypothetical protein
MDLLDRYLQAVKKHLPWQRQDDILAELKANLEAQLEDKEAALGRPLTTAEAEDWLRQLGHPIQVAARYQPQRSLIGPALFPFYLYVLKLAFLWATVIYAIYSVVQIATQTPSQISLLAIVLRLPDGLLRTATWVTLIFAIIEFAAARCPGKFPTLAPPSTNWSPSALPPRDRQLAGGKKPRSFAYAVTEVIFGFLFLVWWLLVPSHPYLLIGPGVLYWHASPFQLAPFSVLFYWWVVAVNGLQLAWRSADLIRGSWSRPRTVQNMVVSAIGLIPLALLLSITDHAYVLLKHPELDQARYGAALTSINLSIRWSALVICAIAILELLFGGGRMILDYYHKRVAAMQ